MKKSGAVLGLLLVSVLLISIISFVGFASASWFSDVWAKITGKSITGSVVYSSALGKPIAEFSSADCYFGQNCDLQLKRGTVAYNSAYTYGYDLWWKITYKDGTTKQYCGNWDRGTSANSVCTLTTANPGPFTIWKGSVAFNNPYSISQLMSDATGKEIIKATLWAMAWVKKTDGKWYTSAWSEGATITLKEIPVVEGCTPSWSCTDWSDCSSAGTQTKTCTDANNCGIDTGKPAESQPCEISPAPTPGATCTSFIYSNWSACSASGTQTRIVASSSPSGCTGGNPIISQSCTVPAGISCTDSDGGQNFYIKGTATDKIFTNGLDDYCFSNEGLYEYICSYFEGDGYDDYFATTVQKYCDYGCSNGRCLYQNETNLTSSINVTRSYCMFSTSDFGINSANGGWATLDECRAIFAGDLTLVKRDICANAALNDKSSYNVNASWGGIEMGTGRTISPVQIGSFFVQCTEPAEPTADCSDLISKVKNPSSLDINGIVWELQYNSSWISTYDSRRNYYAGYSSPDGQSYVAININEVDESQKQDLLQQLKDNVGDQLCSPQIMNNQNVYICINPWSAAYESRNIKEIDKNVGKSVIWVSGNRLFEVWISAYNDYWNCWDEESCRQREDYIHQRKQESLIQAFSNLIDNEPYYVGNFHLNGQANNFVEYLVGLCNSEFVFGEDVCTSGWQCKLEPVICPPHGSQTQTCMRYCGNEEEVRKSELSCSPGMCSGCYVPKWFGYEGVENKCIPYGFRLQHQIGITDEMKDIEQNERLIEQSSGDYSLVIESENKAVLTYAGQDYDLIPGEKVDFNSGEKDVIYEIETLSIIPALEEENGYVNIIIRYTYTNKMPQTMNAYCDLDGQIKQQRTKDVSGGWANCQNNYECESNICSSGECIEVTSMMSKVKVFKSIFVKVVCKLAHAFNVDNYNQCLYKYVGDAAISVA